MDKQAANAIQETQGDLETKPMPSVSGSTAKSINVFQSILSSKSLSMKEKDASRIAQEGFVVLVAGGETTARVLVTSTYHLLASEPYVTQKLRDEIATVMPEPHTRVDVRVLEQLPWLVRNHTRLSLRR